MLSRLRHTAATHRNGVSVAHLPTGHLGRSCAWRAAALGVLAALAAATAAPRAQAAAPLCPPHPAAAPALARLRAVLAGGRFVAYEPTALRVVNGQTTPADAASIRADLGALRPRFDALITYDAIHGAEHIPALAAELKFRALIIGVWDPFDDAQLAAAERAAREFPQLVVGLSLGNEAIFSRRAEPGTLAARLRQVRVRLPRLPLSTTEPFHVFGQPASAPLLSELDFMLANVHPVFQPWFKDAPATAAAQFVVNVVAELRPLACGAVLVKETGEPSAPVSAGFSPQRQAQFYRELRHLFTPSASAAFAYFAAFDAPWRAYDATGVPGAAPAVHEEEANWGLYDAERRPKPAARELPPLPAGG
jgi:exo-beta-1,3-glucanase (GH17 family)